MILCIRLGDELINLDDMRGISTIHHADGKIEYIIVYKNGQHSTITEKDKINVERLLMRHRLLDYEEIKNG